MQAMCIILPSIAKDDDAKRLVGRGKHPVLIEISFVVKSIYNTFVVKTSVSSYHSTMASKK
jgi:hypothetical protein